jgi:hypothetical protein
VQAAGSVSITKETASNPPSKDPSNAVNCRITFWKEQ